MIQHIQKAHETVVHHAKRIHAIVAPHVTWKNIITAKLALFFWFLWHVLLPKLALFKTGALAAMFGIMSSINPFGTHANIEPVCGNGTIEGAEICDGIVIANGVNIPKDVIWKCSDVCQLEINVPRFAEESISPTYISEKSHSTAPTKKTPKKTTKKTPLVEKKVIIPPVEVDEDSLNALLHDITKDDTPTPPVVTKKATPRVEVDEDSLAALLKDITKE